MTKAEERALEAYPVIWSSDDEETRWDVMESHRMDFRLGYEQADKDIKEAIVKHFKYKQDHSPKHTLHWWVYKNVIDKVNEL